ncbi:hypothetical protein [Nocardia wallacei]|uniref:hypothetical protein n=1 Tax=Nocardia wallacei TaxID=480035 RepID=UPI002455D26C|nr:hypothetical protein [Nocardia wallacei]
MHPGAADGAGTLSPPDAPENDEFTMLRLVLPKGNTARDLVDIHDRYKAALQRIAAAPCPHGGGAFTFPKMPGGDRCPSCVAYDALNPSRQRIAPAADDTTSERPNEER